MITKPMLAEKVKDINELLWPMIATPKVDGIRCLNPDGRILTRSFKPIPNKYIRSILEKILPVGADGELFSSDNFQECTSNIMSFDGTPDFVFCLFDYVCNLKTPYIKRLEEASQWLDNADEYTKKFIKFLPYTIINTKEEFLEYNDSMLEKGYEGTILRTPDSPYKCGRSTWKEKWLLKYKPMEDSEAIIVGFEEGKHNENVLGKNELGYAKRSSANAGMTLANTLGKFLVVDYYTGIKFKCGTGKGLTKELRQEIWDNRNKYLGKIIKYKYQKYGVKDKPRIPIWMGFRDKRDM